MYEGRVYDDEPEVKGLDRVLEEAYQASQTAINAGTKARQNGDYAKSMADKVENHIKTIAKGDPGEQGKTGEKGEQGVPGYTPVKGVDYFDGNDGADGVDGYTPIKGVDYFDGAKGEKGDPGTGSVSTVNNKQSVNGNVSLSPADVEAVSIYGGKLGGDYYFEGTIERVIGFKGATSMNHGFFFNPTAMGIYDWVNARNVLNYSSTENVINITVGSLKINGKETSVAGHTHTTAQVTGLDTALAGKAPTSHTHTTAQITGLDTALATKMNDGDVNWRIQNHQVNNPVTHRAIYIQSTAPPASEGTIWIVV